MFKRIFGHQGNESITKSFISAILNQNITDVVLESDAALPKDILDDKVGILDVKVKIDNHTKRTTARSSFYRIKTVFSVRAGYESRNRTDNVLCAFRRR